MSHHEFNNASSPAGRPSGVAQAAFLDEPESEPRPEPPKSLLETALRCGVLSNDFVAPSATYNVTTRVGFGPDAWFMRCSIRCDDIELNTPPWCPVFHKPTAPAGGVGDLASARTALARQAVETHLKTCSQVSLRLQEGRPLIDASRSIPIRLIAGSAVLLAIGAAAAYWAWSPWSMTAPPEAPLPEGGDELEAPVVASLPGHEATPTDLPRAVSSQPESAGEASNAAAPSNLPRLRALEEAIPPTPLPAPPPAPVPAMVATVREPVPAAASAAADEAASASPADSPRDDTLGHPEAIEPSPVPAAASPLASAPPASAQVTFSALAAGTGSHEATFSLAAGAQIGQPSTLVVSGIWSALEQAPCVAPKALQQGGHAAIELDLRAPTWVIVAREKQFQRTPTWLRDFSLLRAELGARDLRTGEDLTFSLFARELGPGRVVLGPKGIGGKARKLLGQMATGQETSYFACLAAPSRLSIGPQEILQ